MDRRVRPISRREYERLLADVMHRAGGLAVAIVRNRADAEDAVREAALKAYRARDEYDPVMPFKGWFFAILRNCCRDLLRRRNTRTTHAVPFDEHEPAAPAPQAQSHAIEWEDPATAMRQLSTPHRQILELKYFGECSYADIAAALDIPHGNVMSRLHAARKALAAVYRQREDAL